jgi:molybdopterin converting factor small subunit
MNVLIPSALRSYTGHSRVEAVGASLAEALADLDRHFPGIRFRMINEQERLRPHIRFFVNGAQTFDLSLPLRSTDELVIVQALSGG